MPIFVVTGFPASYDPPEDESIVLPPGAGRRFKGVPFGVTEDTAAVLRTLSYLEEIGVEAAGTFVVPWEYSAGAPPGVLVPPRTEEAEETPPTAPAGDLPDLTPTQVEKEITAALYSALVSDLPASDESERSSPARPGKSKE